MLRCIQSYISSHFLSVSLSISLCHFPKKKNDSQTIACTLIFMDHHGTSSCRKCHTGLSKIFLHDSLFQKIITLLYHHQYTLLFMMCQPLREYWVLARENSLKHLEKADTTTKSNHIFGFLCPFFLIYAIESCSMSPILLHKP